MIPVARQDEPPEFDDEVRAKGQQFRRDHPCDPPVPTVYWRGRDYWTNVNAKKQLWQRYGGVCAYCCIYVDPNSAYWGTVDHFRPKRHYPDLAYEWDNFRLASTLPNSVKGDHEDVIDPFEVETGWFRLNAATLHVEPGPDLDAATLADVEASISRLRLNRVEHILGRRRLVADYLVGDLTLNALLRDAPFLAREIERWGIVPE
jgi:hypothetical protein